MTNEIFKEEILTDEQLNLVAGGIYNETQLDKQFFNEVLGYNLLGLNVCNAFAENGVRCSVYQGKWDISNDYSIKVNGEWHKHPRWAVLGYVLAQRHYPGFTGKWTDSKYVHSFLKEHFGITDFG